MYAYPDFKPFLNSNCFLQVEEFRLSLDDKAAEPEKVRTFDHAGHRSDVRTVSFSSDNTAIVSGSHESIKVWNRASVVRFGSQCGKI